MSRRRVHHREDSVRVGIDPLEAAADQERQREGRLTLMEEVLLLGLKDREGHLSFWNDSMSYALRGCILVELALRGRIAVREGRSVGIGDREVEIVSTVGTGEVLLDEALRVISSADSRQSVSGWCDLLSGETWNVLRMGCQLKQVRERLCKGLVDKGVLRTAKRSFVLFDMATHPVADPTAKDDLRKRVLSVCEGNCSQLPESDFLPPTLPALRTATLVCAALAANVLDNALTHLARDAREAAFARAEELLSSYSRWPPLTRSAVPALDALGRQVDAEIDGYKQRESQLQVVAGVLQGGCSSSLANSSPLPSRKFAMTSNRLNELSSKSIGSP